MKGWKTWLSAIGLGVLGAVEMVNGQYESGAMKMLGGLGLIGVGHKVEKQK